MKINRRHALSLLAAGTMAPPGPASAATKPHDGKVAFLHGVASGDPLADRVVLWTRVTPADASAAALAVRWEIAEDRAFKHIAARGAFTTGPARDFTVKVDALGLKPARDYHYRFICNGNSSTAGRTRTLPTGKVDKVVLAFTTCALWPGGFFNAYDHIARLEQVDAVVELGDYYYEYGAAPGDYGMATGQKLGRIPEPPHDIVTLADYRTRHAQYKRDMDLQAAHARAPWICVWDDHETANDSWAGGAENHHPATEGPWLSREAAALQAYYEWMPIREPAPDRSWLAIYRAFDFGNLATLIMVESRLIDRSIQLEYDRPGDIPLAVYRGPDDARVRVTDPQTVATVMAAVKAGGPAPAPYEIGPDIEKLNAIVDNPERQMMGVRQEEWLAARLAASVAAGHRWQVLGNQVVMARAMAPNVKKVLGPERVAKLLAAAPESQRRTFATFLDLFTYDIPWDLDGWDGYPAARERVYDGFKQSGGNVVVVSGDSHAFWVNHLKDASGTGVAAEFGVSSVTSPSLGDYVPGLDVGKMFMARNPEVLLNDQNHKGYVLLTLTADSAVGELVAVDWLARPYTAETLARYAVAPLPGPGVGAIEKL